MMNVTPGAISQIENSIISPSLNTLLQLSSIFNISPEQFIENGKGEDNKRGYSIIKKNPYNESNNKNLRITRLAHSEEAKIKTYLVTVKRHCVIDGPILLHKGKEIITVISSSIILTIEGQEQTLREGDSILLHASFIEKWRNEASAPCELIYILL